MSKSKVLCRIGTCKYCLVRLLNCSPPAYGVHERKGKGKGKGKGKERKEKGAAHIIFSFS